jgi:hypothetical protein
LAGGNVYRFNEGIDFGGELAAESEAMTSADASISSNITLSLDLKYMVERCVQAWGKDGDLKKMYLAILSSPDFYSPDAYKNVAKNPMESVLSAYRAKGLSILNFPLVKNELKVDNLELYGEPYKFLAVFADIDKSMITLGLDYRRVAPPTGYPERRGSFGSPSYTVNSVQINHAITDTLADFEMGEREPISHLKGMAAQTEFANIFVGGPKRSEIPNAINNQVLACGYPNISEYLRDDLYGSETLSEAKWDVLKLPSGNFASPLRTIFNNYLTSKEFYLK